MHPIYTRRDSIGAGKHQCYLFNYGTSLTYLELVLDWTWLSPVIITRAHHAGKRRGQRDAYNRISSVCSLISLSRDAALTDPFTEGKLA